MSGMKWRDGTTYVTGAFRYETDMPIQWRRALTDSHYQVLVDCRPEDADEYERWVSLPDGADAWTPDEMTDWIIDESDVQHEWSFA